jgi:hypothetical protein
MKEKWISIVLCLLCALLLIGCGSGASPVPAPSAAPAPSVEPSAAPSAEPSTAPTAVLPDEALKPDVTEAPTAKEEALQIAKGFGGKDLSELIAVLGEPLSSEYGPSCLGDGKDGELKYDGFIVYTTQKGSAETITLVNAAD